MTGRYKEFFAFAKNKNLDVIATDVITTHCFLHHSALNDKEFGWRRNMSSKP